MYLRSYRKVRFFCVCGALITLMMSGCGKHSEYDVKQISYVHSYGGMDGAELDVITSDGVVRKYTVQPYSDSEVDLFEGEIPSENQSDIEEYTISEDNWNSMVDAINDNGFMQLPEELPNVEASDGSSRYIEVVTSEGIHKVGGYCAGDGTGPKHQRFSQIREVIQANINS